MGFKDGIKLPILVTSKTEIKNTDGNIKILAPIRRGMIILGFTGIPQSSGKERNVWNVAGELVFEGTATLGVGTSIVVGPSGKLVIGDGFEITANSTISCHSDIKIGNNCLFSWEILLMDVDGHPIYSSTQNRINHDGKIQIGDHVWVGCRTIILKNSIIPSGCVVAAGSLINSPFDKENCLIAGVKGKIIKSDIYWKNHEPVESRTQD